LLCPRRTAGPASGRAARIRAYPGDDFRARLPPSNYSAARLGTGQASRNPADFARTGVLPAQIVIADVLRVQRRDGFLDMPGTAEAVISSKSV
jgi:hypothetical protein